MSKQIEVIQIAELCHEVNRAYCELLGDHSQLSWKDAPTWQRESAIKGVEFHLANPQATDAASHESWLEQKRQDGWTYGPVKDVEAKTHPCFVPFEGLPPTQQVKDALFKATVEAMRRLVAEPTPNVELRSAQYLLAGKLYDTYCAAVGGKAFNGDPLPEWDDFANDPAKAKQAKGWMATAAEAVKQIATPTQEAEALT